MTKLWLSGLLIASVALLANPRESQAAACSASAVVVVVSDACTTTGATLGGIDTLTITSISLPVGFSVAMTVEEYVGLISVVFSFRNALGNPISLPASGTGSFIGYQIAQTYSELQQVGLGTNGTSGFGNVKETLNPQNFSMTSVNGAPVGPLDYEANNQLVFSVLNEITINTARSLASITNDFFVPEPASMAILGAGLIGLGWARRRRHG